MSRNETLALFLGMLSGDGCLSIKHNGEGYRIYPIDFCNTEREKVILFDNLFFDLFGVRGSISYRKRPNRQIIWNFSKYSVKVVNYLKLLGFPEGVKKDSLRVPEIIWSGTTKEKKLFFSGFVITDGCLRKNGGISFHLGSKRFLEELSELCSHITSVVKPVREFKQAAFTSYQLYLNKHERELLLSPRATMVLGRS